VKRPTRLAAALLTVACLGALGACSDDEGTSSDSSASTSTDPVEVEVGKTFTWNDYTVDDGWKLRGIKRSAGFEEVTTPEVKGTITNTSDEERTALFEMVFSTGGSPVATLSCSAPSMGTGESQEFICPGLAATMPEDYDAVVVREFRSDTTSG
jgi:hypothetical protein